MTAPVPPAGANPPASGPGPAPGLHGQGVGWATSGGQAPEAATVFVAVYKLLLRSVATRGRLLAIAALDVVSVFVALSVHLVGPDDPLRAGVGYANANLTTLVPVAVLVFATATLGDLIDDGSLVYLWLRPVPAHLHVLAAWAATVTITLPLVGAPVLLATALIEPDGGLLAGTLIGALVAIAAYSALFVTGGIRFRRALPWGLAYILIWEGFVALAGETASKLAVRSYVRSILSEMSGERIRLGEFSLAAGIIVPLVVGALVLWYGSRRLAKSDVA